MPPLFMINVSLGIGSNGWIHCSTLQGGDTAGGDISGRIKGSTNWRPFGLHSVSAIVIQNVSNAWYTIYLLHDLPACRGSCLALISQTTEYSACNCVDNRQYQDTGTNSSAHHRDLIFAFGPEHSGIWLPQNYFVFLTDFMISSRITMTEDALCVKPQRGAFPCARIELNLNSDSPWVNSLLSLAFLVLLSFGSSSICSWMNHMRKLGQKYLWGLEKTLYCVSTSLPIAS